jgi:hypothetical protein
VNVLPGRYRGVAVANPGCRLDQDSLRAHFLGREAYRRTRFVVVRDGADTALIAVTKAASEPLFSPITGVEVLAGPGECAFVHDPDADTAIPSDLARVAREQAPGVRAVVVRGRYEHVSFILDPRPLRIVVREVVPPRPAKLLDQARRILAVTEDLPPIELVGELVGMEDLVRAHPAAHHLLPCRGAGTDVLGPVSYLDERPSEQDWTLIGCDRSRQIHEWFYGRGAPAVDICPLRRNGSADLVLTKCCLREEGVEHGDGWTAVPWGSSLDQVRAALVALASRREPAWAPV